jgi:dienelactone hydrolase
VNARSVLETLGIACFGACAGAFCCWLWIKKGEAEASAAYYSSTVQDSQAVIAGQVKTLSRVENRLAGIANEFQQIQPVLKSLAGCPVPIEYQRLLADQDSAISEANASAKAGSGDVRSERRD